MGNFVDSKQSGFIRDTKVWHNVLALVWVGDRANSKATRNYGEID
jgi:hypothetical protein